MKVLFITSTRIGDGVISTAALRYLIQQYPKARFTVACGPLIKELFIQFPEVENVIAVKKEKFHLHWVKLWSKVGMSKWDMVVDLRDSAISRLTCAKQKYIWSKKDKASHKVEQLATLLGAKDPLETQLVFTDKVEKQAGHFIPENEKVLAICPTANWPGKIWPTENFVALIRRLTGPEGIFPNTKVVIIAGPGEEEIAYSVLNELPEEQRINLIAKTPIEVSAAVLKQCAFYIGNDSGLTHCAAAVGIPTLALFGPTRAEEYRPWGEHCAYVSTPETPDDLIGYEGFDPYAVTDSLMKTLSVTDAYEAAQNLYQKTLTRSQ